MFEEDYGFQNLWLHKVRGIVGAQLLHQAPLVEDLEHATDLMVLRSGALRIACRLRRPGYAHNYGEEITITSRRDSGAPCEFQKLMNGWGDWFFYGHTTCEDSEDGQIIPWYLIDLNLWREYERLHPQKREFPNRDAPGCRCWFKPYSVPAMEKIFPTIVVASQKLVSEGIA